MNTSFFLGANSGKGFCSFYNELIDLKEAKAVYILKGCPGCGKSSLMKRVATAAEAHGYDIERIYCSSDPDSLDAVIIPELNKAIVDGTSPHVVEPEFPLAVERYVDLGQFADCTALAAEKERIIDIKEKYSEFFHHVYRLTSCAEHIDNELFDIALGGISVEKLHKKAIGIISREIKGNGAGKKTKRRFLSAISPKGYVSLINEQRFERVFKIEDSYGLGHFLLIPILKAAQNAGYGCIACYNPLNPERLEHLMIPELSLAFVTIGKSHSYTPEYYRKLRLDALIDSTILKNNRMRITILKKVRDMLLNDACERLSEAKAVHDVIEEIYNPHIDFDSLYNYADKLINDILK